MIGKVRYIDYGERRYRESRTAPILGIEKKDRAERLGIDERTEGAFSLPASTVTCGYKTQKPTHYKACARDTPQTPNRKKQRKEKNRNMKDENKRTLYLKVRVSPEEMDAIKKKFQNSGMETLSGFVRAMIFEGYIVQMDENKLRQIYKLAGNIANNINQIAVRVNSTGNIYNNDIAEIKESVNKLWQPLNFLQTKVLQLKH